MKETLLQYAKYNLWANNLMIEALLKLSAEQLDMELVSSFNTIRKTFVHCLSAEYVWLQRLQLVEHPIFLANEPERPFEDNCKHWAEVSKDTIAFIEKQFDDEALKHMVQFYRGKTAYKMPVWQILQHVFNHNTYHRGQLVTMMRQAGITKIPGTDFCLYQPV